MQGNSTPILPTRPALPNSLTRTVRLGSHKGVGGTFIVTNALDPAQPRRFFRLSLP